MTSEETIRSELLARFARLEAHLKLFNAEFREVKALLGASQLAPQSAPFLPAAPPPASVLAAVNRDAVPVPPPVVVAATVIPAAPPVPDDPRVRKSRKRGWLMTRIEQLVEESGPTFSYHTIFEAYRAKWGWKSYPSEGTLGMTLWKIVRRHGHKVSSQGGGRRSTVYEKVRRA